MTPNLKYTSTPKDRDWMSGEQDRRSNSFDKPILPLLSVLVLSWLILPSLSAFDDEIPGPSGQIMTLEPRDSTKITTGMSVQRMSPDLFERGVKARAATSELFEIFEGNEDAAMYDLESQLDLTIVYKKRVRREMMKTNQGHRERSVRIVSPVFD